MIVLLLSSIMISAWPFPLYLSREQRSHEIGFLIKQFLKNVACVDSKMFCNFIAVTLQQISFRDHINSTIAHLFHFALWCRWCPFEHVKKVKENSFSRWNVAFFTRRSAEYPEVHNMVHKESLNFCKNPEFAQKFLSTLEKKWWAF